MKQFLRNNQYGLAVFGILVIFMLTHHQWKLDVDCLCSYTIGYDTGFGGRKLIASLASLLYSTPTLGRLLTLNYVIATVACAMLALLCNQFIKQVSARGHQEEKLSAVYLTALYMACPASLMFLLQFPNFGRLDLYLYMACLLFALLFYHRQRNRGLYYVLTALLLVFCILTHHIFVATYLPFFAALFIYDIWGEGFNAKRLTCYVVLGVIAVATFLAVLLGSTMNVTLDEALALHPNVTLSRKFVGFIYYCQISDHIQQYVIPYLPKSIASFVLTTAFLSPLLYGAWRVWRNTMASQTKAQRNVFVGMQCAFLLLIPAFVITVDYSRWFAAFVFQEILLMAYLIYDSHTPYAQVGEVLGRMVKSHAFCALILIVFVAALGLFGSDRSFECAEYIMSRLHIMEPDVVLPLRFQ